jgi:hypothetical protein
MRLAICISLLMVACGGTHSTVNPTPVNGGGGGGGSGGGGSDGGTMAATPIEFQFSVGDPAIVMSAQVIDGTPGTITIASYPIEATTRVRLAPTTVGFDTFFDAGYCDNVRMEAEQARAGNAFARQLVRGSGAVPVRVNVSPLFGSVFDGAASDGARRAGAGGGSFGVANPLAITSARLGILLDHDAMTNIIGGSDALSAELIQSFNAELGNTLIGGDYAGAIGAKDFLCDLQSGKASLQIDLSGTVGDMAWSGKTFTSGVVRY